MNRKTLLFLLLFFATRIPFINPGPVFFDSREYLDRLSHTTLLSALIDGHVPLHTGYILVFWPVFHFANKIGANPSLLVIYFQILIAGLSLICFYKVVYKLTDSSTALKSTLIASLLPLFWIENSTIMMETTYISFFLFSLYFLTKRNLFFSLLFFGMSYLTHVLVILWLPLLLYIGYILNKKRFKLYMFSSLFTLTLFSLLSGYFVSLAIGTNLFRGLLFLFGSKLNEHTHLSLDIHTTLLVLRNTFVPLFANNTILITILALITLIISYFKNKQFFILSLLWTAPVLSANQWWDTLLFGRHATIASFALALLCGYLVRKQTIYFYLLIFYLLFTSLPTLNLLKKDIPYIQMRNTTIQLPKNNLILESHFVKPIVDNLYKGQEEYVNEPSAKQDIEIQIRNTLSKGERVFVSSQALSEPYGQYSGPYLHVLSLSYKKDFSLKETIEKFSLKEYKVVNKEDNLLYYEIASDSPSHYPNIVRLNDSKRRIDFSDPIYQLLHCSLQKI